MRENRMNPEIYTPLDANINRCIEGIRVCEDIFRFSVKNIISAEFKNLRHKITVLISHLPSGDLLRARDVLNDEQKFINTSSEMNRGGIKDIFRSNIRRGIEASRVIEEFGKNVDPGLAAGFQEIRFALYELEKSGWMILEKNRRIEKLRYSLYAIIDSAFVPADRMEETSGILALSGADIIQLRMKNVPDREFLPAAEKVSAVCRNNDILFIVNDRADIAILSGADGLHIGQDDIPLSRAREITGGDMIIGISVTSAGEASAAQDADYVAAGPVFATSSKDGSMLEGLGMNRVREICACTAKPVAAIGGVNESNARNLLDAGVLSLSVISALYKDGKISENTAKLKHIIRSYGDAI